MKANGYMDWAHRKLTATGLKSLGLLCGLQKLEIPSEWKRSLFCDFLSLTYTPADMFFSVFFHSSREGWCSALEPLMIGGLQDLALIGRAQMRLRADLVHGIAQVSFCYYWEDCDTVLPILSPSSLPSSLIISATLYRRLSIQHHLSVSNWISSNFVLAK